MAIHPEDDRAKWARDLFLTDSNNCAQSILHVFANLNEDTEMAVVPLVWALGGGLASQGHVCGTVLGAVMVLGARLRHERSLTTAKAEVAIAEFICEFQTRNGSLQCRDIVGELNPERCEQICRPMVYNTALMIERLLAGYEKESNGDE